MLLWVLLLGMAYGVIAVSNCQIITVPGTYLLVSDVSGAGTCFEILADDVTLDCSGYRVNVGNGQQFSVVGQRNVVIENCVVENSKKVIDIVNSSNVVVRNISTRGPFFQDMVDIVGSNNVSIERWYVSGSSRFISNQNHVFWIGGPSYNITLKDILYNADPTSYHKYFILVNSSYGDTVDLLRIKNVTQAVGSGNTIFSKVNITDAWFEDVVLNSTYTNDMFVFDRVNLTGALFKNITTHQRASFIINRSVFKNVEWDGLSIYTLNSILGRDAFGMSTVTFQNVSIRNVLINDTQWTPFFGFCERIYWKDVLLENATVISPQKYFITSPYCSTFLTLNFSNVTVKDQNLVLIRDTFEFFGALFDVDGLWVENVSFPNAKMTYSGSGVIRNVVFKDIIAGNLVSSSGVSWNNVLFSGILVNGSYVILGFGNTQWSNITLQNLFYYNKSAPGTFIYSYNETWENLTLANLALSYLDDFVIVPYTNITNMLLENASVITNNSILLNNSRMVNLTLRNISVDAQRPVLISEENSNVENASISKIYASSSQHFIEITGSDILVNLTLNDSVIKSPTFFHEIVDGFVGRANISDFLIYNNIINSTTYMFVNSSSPIIGGSGIYFNISKTPGINIVYGLNLGGNFWADPTGTGFSETCADNDNDFICDNTFSISPFYTDFYPLAKSSANLVLSCMNITSPGYYILINSVSWMPTSPNQVCINISANNVYLDGYGNNILSLDGSLDPIAIATSGSNITIANITLQNHSKGVLSFNPSMLNISHVLSDNQVGVYLAGIHGDKVLVEDSMFNGGAVWGDVLLSNSEFEDLEIANTTYGIFFLYEENGSSENLSFRNLTLYGYSIAGVNITFNYSNVSLSNVSFQQLRGHSNKVLVGFAPSNSWVKMKDIVVNDVNFTHFGSPETIKFSMFRAFLEVENLGIYNVYTNATTLLEMDGAYYKSIKNLTIENVDLDNTTVISDRKVVALDIGNISVTSLRMNNISAELNNAYSVTLLALNSWREANLTNATISNISGVDGVYFYSYYPGNITIDGLTITNSELWSYLLSSRGIYTFNKNITLKNINASNITKLDRSGSLIIVDDLNGTILLSNITIKDMFTNFSWYGDMLFDIKANFNNTLYLWNITILNITNASYPILGILNLNLNNYTDTYVQDITVKDAPGSVLIVTGFYSSDRTTFSGRTFNISRVFGGYPIINIQRNDVNLTLEDIFVKDSNASLFRTVAQDTNVRNIDVDFLNGDYLLYWEAKGIMENLSVKNSHTSSTSYIYSGRFYNVTLNNTTSSLSFVGEDFDVMKFEAVDSNTTFFVAANNSSFVGIYSEGGMFLFSTSYPNNTLISGISRSGDVNFAITTGSNFDLSWNLSNVTFVRYSTYSQEMYVSPKNANNVTLNININHSRYQTSSSNGNAIHSVVLRNSSNVRVNVVYYNISNSTSVVNTNYGFFYAGVEGERVENISYNVTVLESVIAPYYNLITLYPATNNTTNTSVKIEIYNSTIVPNYLVALFNPRLYSEFPDYFTLVLENNIIKGSANHVYKFTSTSYSDLTSLELFLNRTYRPGPSIIGGLYMGGNFWEGRSGNGYSIGCWDNNNDDICDYPYYGTLNMVDFYPLTNASYKRVDAGPPNISLNLTSYYWLGTTSGTLLSYYVVDDNQVNYTEIYINGSLLSNITTNSPSYSSTISGIYGPGVYNASVHAYDIVGNLGIGEVMFEVLEIPVIWLDNITITNNTSQVFNAYVNASDVLEYLLVFTINNVNQTLSLVGPQNVSFSAPLSSADYVYNLTLIPINATGNAVHSVNYLLYADTVVPEVALASLANVTAHAINYTINYSLADDRELAYLELYLNSTLSQNLSTGASSYSGGYRVELMSGFYDVKLLGFDKASNSNISTGSFYIFTPPNITVSYPYYTNNSTTFHIDVDADPLLGINLTIMIENTTYNFTFAGSNNITFTHTFSSSGIHPVNITLNYLNAEGEHATTFYVYADLVNPTLEVSSVSNYTASSVSVNYTVNASDDMNLSFIEIYLNHTLTNITVNSPAYNNGFSVLLTPGYYMLNVTAYDNVNRTNISLQSFYVFAPPTYWIVYPEITNDSTFPINIDLDLHPALVVNVSIAGAFNNSTITQGPDNITFYPSFTTSGNYSFNITISPVNAEGTPLTTQFNVWVDLVSPTIEITPAVNYTSSNEIVHIFSYNLTDDMLLSYVEIYLNGSLTNISLSDLNYSDNITLNVSPGEYHLDMIVYDLANNSATANRTFYVFNVPEVNIDYPNPTADENVSFNVSLNSSPLLGIVATFQIDNSTYTLNLSGSNSYNVLFNHTFNSSGIYPFNLTLSYTNANGTNFYNRSIYVDLFPPTLNLSWIDNVIANQTTIDYIINASDEMELVLAEIYLNSTLLENLTLATLVWNYNNTTLLYPGYYNLTVRVYDKLMHVTEITRTFFVFPPPQVNHTYSLNNTSVCINTSVVADLLLNLTIDMFGANTSNSSLLRNQTNYTLFQCFNISHGDLFGFNITATNVNNTTIFNITYNTSYLNNISFNITKPTNGSASPVPHEVYVFTILPTNLSCIYNITQGNRTIYENSSILESPGWINFSISVPDGVYTFNVYCNHTLNNSISINYTVQNPVNAPPSISIQSPSSSTYREGETILFSVYANDDRATTLSCSYNLTSSGSFTVAAGSTYNFTRSFSPGNYTFEVVCNDGQGLYGGDRVSFEVISETPVVNTTKNTTPTKKKKKKEVVEEVQVENNTTALNITKNDTVNITKNVTVKNKTQERNESEQKEEIEAPTVEAPKQLEARAAGAFSIYNWVVSSPVGLSLIGIGLALPVALLLIVVRARIRFDEKEGITVISVKNMLNKPVKGLKLTINGQPYYTDQNGEIIIQGRVERQHIKANRIIIWDDDTRGS